jgi:hypothetical protein
MRGRRSPVVAIRIAASLSVMGQIGGCTSWRVHPLAPVELVNRDRPGEIQLRQHDGKRVVLKRPTVEGDSLVGVHQRDTTRVAVADVKVAAVRRFDWLETFGVVAISTGALFGLACAMACGFGPIGFDAQ